MGNNYFILICVLLGLAGGQNVAFWHIYGNEKSNHHDIILDQWRVITSSGLINNLDKIYYTTIGTASGIGHLHEKLYHWKHFSSGFETLTLKHMQQYCKNNTRANVLYFHNKGSFHPTQHNFRFRQALDCYNLNPHCLSALNSGQYDTCGLRISPIPHVHYSGNYFWATCKHVIKLPDPLSMLNNDTMIRGTENISQGLLQGWCLGEGRWFAETWVGSLPLYSPADCMGTSRHIHYLYGEDIALKSFEAHCPNTKHNMSENWKYFENKSLLSSPLDNVVAYGESCGTPPVSRGILTLSFRITKETKNESRSCSNVHCMVRRSFLWYGRPPVLYLAWMKLNMGPVKWKPYAMYDHYLNSTRTGVRRKL
jgi:hypothetical protein